MGYTKEQLEKLPRWAQNEIISLESRKCTLEQKIMEYQGDKITNTYIRDGLKSRPLPYNAQIEIYTGEAHLNKVSIYARKNGDIDINTDSRSSKTMVILPRAANSFFIRFIED